MKTLKFNKENATGAIVLSRADMKNVMGGLEDSAMPCDKVVCQADSWCCDTSGVCVSRDGGKC